VEHSSQNGTLSHHAILKISKLLACKAINITLTHNYDKPSTIAIGKLLNQAA
jgi:hypothetical protein